MARMFLLLLAAYLPATGLANPDRLVPDAVLQPQFSTQDTGTEAVGDFGTPVFYQAVDGTSFAPLRDLDAYERSVTSGAFYCRNFGTPYHARAPIAVPHGVQLNSTRVWLYDEIEDYAVSIRLESVCQLDSAASTPVVTDLGGITTQPGFTGGNFSAFDNGALGTITDNQSCTYRFTASFIPGCGGGFFTLGVQKARVSWRRFTPPAPATATFDDVPTNAQFFREIEALATTGITAGCTATTFCPDTVVTRRQMAAFLARALGLPRGVISDPANP